jgi:hypothetical protein
MPPLVSAMVMPGEFIAVAKRRAGTPVWSGVTAVLVVQSIVVTLKPSKGSL